MPSSVKNELAIFGSSSQQSGTRYRAIVTNECGIDTSRIAILHVKKSFARVISHPVDQERCIGDSVSFTATVADALQREWLRNGRPIPGAAGPTFSIPSITEDDFGFYAVRIYGGCGSAISRPALLRVFLPPVITVQPQSQTKKLGEMTGFTVHTNVQVLRYQWYQNGNPLPGATTQFLRIDSVQKSDEGIYHVEIYWVCGSITSETAQLTITPTDVKSPNVPEAFHLSQNYPNPFSDKTTIELQIPDNGLQTAEIRNLKSVISFKVFDIFGREVLDMSSEAIENSQFTIHHSQLPRPGVYFYRLTTPTVTQTRAMIFTR